MSQVGEIPAPVEAQLPLLEDPRRAAGRRASDIVQVSVSQFVMRRMSGKREPDPRSTGCSLQKNVMPTLLAVMVVESLTSPVTVSLRAVNAMSCGYRDATAAHAT